nr:unnamed protein product [Haemonchus contortus]
MVSREEQVHQHPLLRSILDDMVAINSAQARAFVKRSDHHADGCPACVHDVPRDPLGNWPGPTDITESHGVSSLPDLRFRGLGKGVSDIRLVVLVMSLASHRRNDCLVRGNYRTCPRCGESIERSSFHRHVGRKDCRPVGSYATKCPLCAALVPSDDEESWKKHLTMQCKHNPRRRMSNEIKRNTFNSFEPLSEEY